MGQIGIKFGHNLVFLSGNFIVTTLIVQKWENEKTISNEHESEFLIL